MRVLGISGWSGAGKTTLITAMLPLLRASGLRISTIKHAHHGFDLDRPGKDSWRHREAGAEEVLVASSRRWALLHELQDEAEPRLEALLARLSPVDLVLVEGFKSEPFAKLEVWREAIGKPPLWPGRADILAVATDRPDVVTHERVLPLDDVNAVCTWVAQFMLLPARAWGAVS